MWRIILLGLLTRLEGLAGRSWAQMAETWIGVEADHQASGNRVREDEDTTFSLKALRYELLREVARAAATGCGGEGRRPCCDGP